MTTLEDITRIQRAYRREVLAQRLAKALFFGLWVSFWCAFWLEAAK